jgi:uncharacterized DUF497 family protein
MDSGFEFDWDDENIRHIAAHKVSPEEFEQVMSNDPLELDCSAVDGEYRYRAVGPTDTGRLLLVVYTVRGERLRAVTAFRASIANRRMYMERR